MIIKPIRTRVLVPPKDNLWEVLERSLPKKLKENTIVAITSKVVSIGEGRCIPIKDIKSKDALIKRESHKWLPRDTIKGGWVMHTVTQNLLIPTAGIDESNALEHYILWPKDPKSSARKIQTWLKRKYKVKNIGVIITDSHSVILRRGTTGIALSYYGFKPINDYRHMIDLFNRKLKITQSNIADGLAAAVVVCQGEGSEQFPIALISDIPFVTFVSREWKPKSNFSSHEVPLKEDLYFQLLESLPWKKGKNKKLS